MRRMGCAESRQNDDFFQRALKSGFLLKNDDDETKQVTYNACKKMSTGPIPARRILDADFSFTYNTAGEDFLRLAKERLDRMARGTKDGGMSLIDKKKEFEVMTPAFTTPIQVEAEFNDETKFDKLRIPLRVSILGVDGLDHECLNSKSRVTCRMHLMDEFGNPAPKKPFMQRDRRKYPHCAELQAIDVTQDEHGDGSEFRARGQEGDPADDQSD